MKFIESRKKFYALSLIVIIIGLLAMGINGARGKGFFEKDIEFTGVLIFNSILKNLLQMKLKQNLQRLQQM
ncbi:hypothetical protein [Cellulosilyticum ruminicola]|uniref:hypothetical protein n=1 Tax=Cellulosilyticum ruminicola TaxID=425254 RepID=UPI001FA7AF63|nr:hypothetical protein [Cellulosilyticum ruminicola]